MALIVNNTNYDGEVVEQLLVAATTRNDLVAEGHIHIHEGVHHKLSLPKLKLGRTLQRRKAMPQSSDSKGDYDYSESVLEPQDVMSYVEFNPAIFEHIWRPFQPKGELVFEQLPIEVQNTLLSELSKSVDMELGELFLTGVKGSGPRDFFDGILTRIVADSYVIKPAATEITFENVLPTLHAIKTKIPKAKRKSQKMKIFMSVEDFDIYDYVVTEKPYKGQDYTAMNPERYKGFPIVVLPDMPKDVIFVAEGTSDLDSNLWAAVNLSEDTNAIQIGKVANNGELYFFKMLMKIDTNIVFGEEIVLWDGRGIPAPAGFSARLLEVEDDNEDFPSAEDLTKTAEDLAAKAAFLDDRATELSEKEKLLNELEADLKAREAALLVDNKADKTDESETNKNDSSDDTASKSTKK